MPVEGRTGGLRSAHRTMRAMHPDGRRIGAHLPLGHGMVHAVERAHEIGLDSLQVFSDNPTAWRRRAEPPPELPAFRARIAELGMGPIAIHAAYLVNLAGSDPGLVERSVEVLATELRVAPSFAARFVNVHVGSHRGTDAASGIARLADGVARVLAETDDGPDAAILVLENSAGSGDVLGATGRGAGRDPRRDRRARRPRPTGRDLPRHGPPVGRGLRRSPTPRRSTASSRSVDRLDRPRPSRDDPLQRFAGRARVARAIATSTSARARSGPPGWRRLLSHPRLGHVAYYLETPGMDEGYDALNAARVRDLAAGRPLTELPPEAATIGRSRSRIAPADRRGHGRRADDRLSRPSEEDAVTEPSRRSPARSSRASSVALLAVLVLAAVVRFVGLPTRGTWDADQGHDMLVLLGLVRDGVDPAPRAADLDRRLPPRRALLLPPRPGGLPVRRRPDGGRRGDRPRRRRRGRRSRGGWRGRSPARSRGSSRRVVMAVSSSAIDESTFIWNPNLIALSSAVALAGAVAGVDDRARALVAGRRVRRPRDDAVPRPRDRPPAAGGRPVGRRVASDVAAAPSVAGSSGRERPASRSSSSATCHWRSTS